MTNVNQYVRAATRENTRKSYRAAVEHFEDTWGGFLPATADSIASYLAHYAPTLSLSTLRQRLAALAVWHLDQGFPDPTKAPHVKKVLKGISELHPYTQRQAKPLQIEQLRTIDTWIEQQLGVNQSNDDSHKLLRDRALILIGFWRAFRGDELTRITVENITVVPGQGMEIFLPKSKTDRSSSGQTYRVPALKQLCPVAAYESWIEASEIKQGSLFPSINRWGHIAEEALHPSSVIKIIKTYCKKAGLSDSEAFSGHSLRRGFATWAASNQWDLKTLMEYVGWRDVQSALRYIEVDDPFSQARIEGNLSKSPQLDKLSIDTPTQTQLRVKLAIEPFSQHGKSSKKAVKNIEKYCLVPLKMTKADEKESDYTITVEHSGLKELDELLDELLHQMYQIASENQSMLDAHIFDPNTNTYWD